MNYSIALSWRKLSIPNLFAGVIKLHEPLISFHEYSFKYSMRENYALENVNLSISKGEFIVITGASGSGKSTLAYSILGLIPFFYSGEKQGEVLIKNKNITELNLANHSRDIGYISQRIDNSFATPYVFSEFAFPLEYQGNNNEIDINEKIKEHALQIGVDRFLTRKVHNLSEGEKQLVSFGSATINNCSLIIADEPLADLDIKNKKNILNKLEEAHKLGKTIIITTHGYEEYLPNATRLIQLSNGRIIEDEPVKKPEKRINRFDYDKILFNLNGYQNITDEKQNILEVRNLSFKYSNEFIINDISLSIEKGKITGIIGDNGSGKTTILKILSGLLKPNSGSVQIEGSSLGEIKWNTITKKIGFVFQDPDKQFFESTVKDEMSLISRNIKQDYDSLEVLKRKLQKCGLGGFEAYNPHSLSYGEKKRLTFLSAIQHDPDIILIDEITVGMDEQNKKWALEQLLELKKRGKTIVLVSHDWAWLAKIVDSLIYIKNGHITQLKETSSLNNIIQKNFTNQKSLKEEV